MKIQVTRSEWEVIEQARISGMGALILAKLGGKFYDTKWQPGLLYGFEVIN